MCDETFPERAKAAGQSIVVGGNNYGQGSSREHAALVPLYLGVRAVITKSFARIHVANLINAGIMPLTFKNPEDYDKVSQGDVLRLSDIYAGMDSGEITLTDVTTGEQFTLVCSFTQRQKKEILKAGSLLKYVAKKRDNKMSDKACDKAYIEKGLRAVPRPASGTAGQDGENGSGHRAEATLPRWRRSPSAS